MKQELLAARGRVHELEDKIQTLDLEGRGNHTLLKQLLTGFKPWHEVDLDVADSQLERQKDLKKQRAEAVAELKQIKEEYGLE